MHFKNDYTVNPDLLGICVIMDGEREEYIAKVTENPREYDNVTDRISSADSAEDVSELYTLGVVEASWLLTEGMDDQAKNLLNGLTSFAQERLDMLVEEGLEI